MNHCAAALAPAKTAQPPQGRLSIQRPCACGDKAGARVPGTHGDRGGSRAKPEGTAGADRAPPIVPPLVQEVLRASGQPLDPVARGQMERHFGHDFGRVRVHTDARAAESARILDARS